MRINKNWPDAVFSAAHVDYPAAVGLRGLYGVAFFGHGRPSDLGHKETTGSIWRGLCRKKLREYQEAGLTD